MKKMTAEQLAYMAGIIDGEGGINIERSLYVSKRDKSISKYYIGALRVGMKSKETILALYECAGMGSVYHHKNGMSLWYVSKSDAKKLIVQLLPYLITKKGQALLLLDYFHNDDQQYREKLYWELRIMKKGKKKIARIRERENKTLRDS
jgi:hypothetical protein